MDVRYEMPSRRSTRLEEIAPGDTFIHESLDGTAEAKVWMRTDYEYDSEHIACVCLQSGHYKEIACGCKVIAVKTEAQVVFVREWG